MIQKSQIQLVFVFVIFLAFMHGCAVNKATATVDQTTDLSTLKVFYVKKYKEDSRDTNLLIENKLVNMGFEVSENVSDVDALITYVDKWWWDITMYMLELTVTIRDPKTDFPLASGNSLHTSLTRKSPEEMVDEVLTNIFSGSKSEGTANVE